MSLPDLNTLLEHSVIKEVVWFSRSVPPIHYPVRRDRAMHSGGPGTSVHYIAMSVVRELNRLKLKRLTPLMSLFLIYLSMYHKLLGFPNKNP